MASFSGLGALGGNAFALERQGLGLLFWFPVDRFRILVGKNLGVIVLRLPALARCCRSAALRCRPAFVPAVATVVLLTLVLAAAADNFLSILFPVPVPAAGRNPYAPLSGSSRPGRGPRHPRRDGRDPRRLGALRVPRLAARAARRALAVGDHPAARPRGRGRRLLHGDLGAARASARREPELVARVAGED